MFFSFWYARRQFNLAEDPTLRYHQLNAFGASLNSLLASTCFYTSVPNKLEILLLDNEKKLIVFMKSNLLFVFNFHPTCSFEHLELKMTCLKSYFHERKLISGFQVIFHTDKRDYGGFERLQNDFIFPIVDRKSFKVYIPSRVAFVCKPI